jgi:soluble lytic murein transglycosylase-like protein
LRHTRLGILLALLLLTAPELSAESAGGRAALSAYLNRALSAEDGFEDRYAAEVWLVDMQQRLAHFLADPAERLDLLTRVHQQASELNLPPELVLSVIEVESAFDRYAISRAGAQGLMQVMPFWKDEIGRSDDNLTDTPTNLRYGCHILRFYLDREDQNLSHALAAYNGSSGSLRYPNKVRAAWESHWRTAPLDW